MNKFIVFSIAGEEFGIELGKVFEIIKPQKAIPCPGTPDHILGIFNLRETVVPLMDLRKRLGVDVTPAKEKIIVVYIHGEKIGLMVDSIAEIISIEQSKIASPPALFKGLKPEYIQGIGKIPGRLIIILNLDNLMSSEEIILIGDLAESSSTDDEEENEGD